MASSGIRHSKSKWCLIPLILCFEASALTAQDTNSQVEPPQSIIQPVDEGNPLDPGRFLRNEYQIWTSPFRPSSWKSPTMKKYGIPFLVVAAGLFASDQESIELLPNTSDQIKWSGRVSQMGASYTLAGFAGATYLIGKTIHNEHASKTGLMGLEALAHTEVVVYGLKYMTARERPNENDHEGRLWKGSDSFPSGHAATSFAVATVFAREYGDHIIVPIAAYSLATLVTVSRAGAHQHWVSDLFVGGALGFLIGRYVYKTHHDPNVSGGAAKHFVSRLRPEFGIGENGPALYWKF